MGRPRKLNEASSEVIEKNFLEENPEGHPSTESVIVQAKYIPEMRKFIFLNGRDPGCALTFHYASKTHPLETYTLYHGFEHVLPLEVIEHLENCYETYYAYRKTDQGSIEQYPKSRKYIFQCKNQRKVA